MTLRGKVEGLLDLLKVKYSPFHGVTLAILSSIVAGLSSVLMKMNANGSPLIMVIYMFGFQATFTFISIIYNQNDAICVKGERLWFLQRVLLDGFGMYCMAQSIRYISALDMTAILFCQPVLISLTSPLITKQRFQIKDILLALLAVVGVALICRPSFLFRRDPGEDDIESQRLLGVMWAAFCCVAFTYLTIVTKKMPKTPVMVAMFNIGLVNFALMLTVLCFTGVTEGWPFCGLDAVILMLAMVLGVLTTLLESASIKKEKVTTFSTSITTQIVFIMLLEALFLKLVPLWSDYVGAVLIVTSILLTVLFRARKHNRSRKDKVGTLLMEQVCVESSYFKE